MAVRWVKQRRWAVWLAFTAVMMLAASGVANASGYDKLQSIGQQPANPAGIGQGHRFLRLFAGSGVGLGNNILPPADIIEQIQGAETDDDFLDILPSEGVRVWLDSANHVELGIGPIEIRTGVSLVGAMQVRPDILELGIEEPEPGRTYEGDGTEAEWAGFANLSAGGSLGLPAVARGLGWNDLRIGGRVHALSGLGYGRAEIHGDVEIHSGSVAGQLVGELWDRQTETDLWHAGQGYAVDVGILGRLNERLTLGVAVVNIGQLTWSDVRYQRFESDFDVTGGGDPELEWNQVADEQVDVVWHLPRRVEGSLGYRASDTIHLGAGLVQTTYFDHDGRSADARTDLHASIVWRGIPLLPIAAGVNYSGVSGWSFSTGAALDLGPLHVVAQVDNLPLPKTGRELGASFGLGLSF